MQRAEERWTLWGRDSSHGGDAEERQLGSFDAVVLCDALTARPGCFAAHLLTWTLIHLDS